MTRCLYAQLTSQKFVADRRSPWAAKEPFKEVNDVAAKKAWNLGMRISSGFEIIMTQRKKKGNDDASRKTGSAEANETDNEIDDQSPEWKTFLSSLERNGFFQGELRGSKKWKECMEKAQQFYRETVLAEKKMDEVRSAWIFAIDNS